MSEIKFKVRYSALLLKDFTVADIIRVTGLNPESVRTEVQRMRQEGLLFSTPHLDRQKKRGGRPSVYHLSEDPDKLVELSESVEAFYPPLPLADKPSSRYYKLAKQLIDEALVSDGSANHELLSDAENYLGMAEQAEGGILATELVKAYLEYERARIMYLNGKYEQALDTFQDLRKFFESNNLETIVKRIDEYILCLNANINFTKRTPGRYGRSVWARCLIDTLDENNFQAESPLVVLILDLLQDFSSIGVKELMDDIVQEFVEATSRRAEMDRIENFFQKYQENQALKFSSEQSSSLKNDETPIPVSNSRVERYREEPR